MSRFLDSLPAAGRRQSAGFWKAEFEKLRYSCETFKDASDASTQAQSKIGSALTTFYDEHVKKGFAKRFFDPDKINPGPNYDPNEATRYGDYEKMTQQNLPVQMWVQKFINDLNCN